MPDYRIALPLLALLALGCERKAPPDRTPAETTGVGTAVTSPAPAPTKPTDAAPRLEPAAQTVFAMGDVHGDYDAMMKSLRLGGVVDDAGKWVAGNATLVQTGDLLDRGDDEQKIVDYLEALQEEAAAAGGEIVLMNGNHEVMNVAGDLRYVTPGGFADFEDVEGLDVDSPALARVPAPARARMAAFLPGGPYAKKIADHPIVAVVGDTVFAHGGVLPQHVEYGIERINDETQAWMEGKADPPLVLQSEEAPIWTRLYSQEPPDCATLDEALAGLGAARMVVGHTVQREGITSACDGKIWRVDVGMAAHYGGKPSILKIDPDGVRAIGPGSQQE